VVVDLLPGCATLGGLYSGLASSTHGRVFAVGCDMPFLSAAVIERMAELGHGADVVMPRLATGLQPMHAIYSKACLDPVKRMAAAGALRVQDLCDDEGLSVRLVDEDELRGVDPDLLSFFNINTPADLELALKLVAHRASLHD
jgi:molybdopterin-guanine dinucleotide biosynthesis protein A